MRETTYRNKSGYVDYTRASRCPASYKKERKPQPQAARRGTLHYVRDKHFRLFLFQSVSHH